MKVGLGLAVIVALGALAYFFLTGEEEPVQEVAPVAVETVAAEDTQLADLALPPEVTEELDIDQEIEDPPQEMQKERLTKPRRLSKTKLPDGRVELRFLTPIYVGGKQKNVIRILRASPRLIRRDAIQQRTDPGPDLPKGRKGN